MSLDPQSPYQRLKFHFTIRGVVDADEGDGKCAEIRTKLEAKFRNTILTQLPLHEINPADRAYGEHNLPCKTADPQPQKCPPYRSCGIRGAAFRPGVGQQIFGPRMFITIQIGMGSQDLGSGEAQ